jgi:ankyrin repeat protein
MGQLKFLRLLVFVCALIFAGMPVGAAVKNTASNKGKINTLLMKRKYGAAIKLLTTLAKSGDARAQFKLGSMYRVGLGVESDPQKAKFWFAKAAAQGHAAAQSVLDRLQVSVPATPKNIGSVTASEAESMAMQWLPIRPDNQMGWLTVAASRNLPLVVKHLHEAKVASTSTDLDQALLAASTAGNVDIASNLIAAGANPNVSNERARTPVMIAAAAGNSALLNQLLTRNPELATVDKNNGNVLHYAAANCDAAMFKILAGEGAVESAIGTPALIIALQRCPNAADFIASIDHKMANVKDGDGRSFIWHVSTIDNPALIKTAMDAGADLNVNDAQGFTPLHAAALTGRVENLRMLLDMATASDVTSSTGVTPLMLAASVGCLQCVELLASKSADIDFKDIAGETALLHAVRMRQIDTVKLLLKLGANPIARSLGDDTPEKLAVRMGSPVADLFKPLQ